MWPGLIRAVLKRLEHDALGADGIERLMMTETDDRNASHEPRVCSAY